MKYVLYILISTLLATGCALQEGAQDASGPNSNVDQSFSERAQSAFQRHDIVGANAIYREQLAATPTNGEAAAGLAITDLLLFPYNPAVTKLIIENLGGSGALNQKRDVIYQEPGFLFFLAKAVPWADSDDGLFTGMRGVLEPDLPWQGDALDSFEGFIATLDRPLDLLMGNLAAIADAMIPIEANIEIALDDESFRAVFLPNQVFRHPSLTFNMTKPDLAVLSAAISGTRSFLYFVSAYQFNFSLLDAFGPQWQEITSTDPRFVDGYTTDDYIIAYLNQNLFRTIRNGDRLKASGDAAKRMLQNIRRALRLGETSPVAGTLGWSEADPSATDAAVELLEAVEASLDNSTTLPGIAPTLALDLSPLFRDGVVLAPEFDWVERVEISDDFGTFFEWTFTQDANDEVFGSFFTPQLGSDFEWEDGDDIEFLADTVFGSVTDDVEDVYLSTQ